MSAASIPGSFAKASALRAPWGFISRNESLHDPNMAKNTTTSVIDPKIVYFMLYIFFKNLLD
jgi:hypothetical protein